MGKNSAPCFIHLCCQYVIAQQVSVGIQQRNGEKVWPLPVFLSVQYENEMVL